jgi:hypothetical protein
MPAGQGKRAAAAIVPAVAILVGGCSSGHGSETALRTSSATSGDAGTYSAAIAEVQAYLDMWASQGPYAAAAKYLVPEEQARSGAVTQWPPGPDDQTPVLLSGTVRSYRPTDWKSPNAFTLEVTMDLHFRGDATRWNMNEGVNDRFFTFTRPDTANAYRMYEATSP